MIKKIKWIVHRASVMPLGEYVYRFKNLISSIVKFFLIKFGKESLYRTCLPEDYILRRSIFSNVFEDDIRKILPAKYIDECILEADQIVHNRLSFFDLENDYLGDNINWNFDYKNKIAFPLRYSFFGSRSFRNVGGDIKYVFEINKHQELVRLSEANILTGDESYTNKLVENINSWRQQCPYLYSVNWASSTVMAYRLVSWTISFEMLRSRYSFSDDFLHKWAQSVYQHVRLIRKSYSKFSSAGNHLISEAVGVFVACLCWRIFFKGQELSFLDFAQKEAYSIILNEVEAQIFPDGVNHEQAVSYQVFAANQFFIALFFGINSGVLFPDGYHKRLHESAKFLFSVLNKEGTPPNFGDEDSAWAFRFCDKTSSKFLDQLSVFAVFFNDFSLFSIHHLSETAYWLFGFQAVQVEQLRAERMVSINTKKNVLEENVFSHGGYYVAASNRDSENEVLTFFDFGPLGTQSTGAHGHADALSICLSLGGIQVFVDSGTYTYKNIPERKALRVTSAHNTLNFGKLSCQDKYLGPFLWGARHKTFAHSEGHGRFVGNVKWWSGETHSRELTILENALTINDQWHGKCFPSIVFYINPLWSDSVYRKNSECVYIETKKIKCTLRSVGNRAEIEKTKISPAFYELLESKKIIIRPQQLVGMQKTQISWEFT